MRPKQLRDILPLIHEQGKTYREIADKYKVKTITVHKWVKLLRLAGFEVKPNKGKLKI